MTVLRVIMLTGSMRPSPLQAASGRPVVSLPLRDDQSLFEAWLEVLAGLGQPVDLRVATNLEEDLSALRGLVRSYTSSVPWIRSATVERDPQDWRGSAGVLRDLAGDEDDAASVSLVIEGGCLPPNTLAPLLPPLEAGASMVVGSTVDQTPVGVVACRRAIIHHIPPVGYFDLKEQLVPRLRRGGLEVWAAFVADELVRIRDLESYHRAVCVWADRHPCRVGAAGVDRSPWRRLGVSVVEEGAQVDFGVILKDSIVLRGAEIGAAAVLSGCLVVGGGSVAPGARVSDQIVLRGGRAGRGRRGAGAAPMGEGAAL